MGITDEVNASIKREAKQSRAKLARAWKTAKHSKYNIGDKVRIKWGGEIVTGKVGEIKPDGRIVIDDSNRTNRIIVVNPEEEEIARAEHSGIGNVPAGQKLVIGGDEKKEYGPQEAKHVGYSSEYTCKGCGKKFGSEYDLSEHQKISGHSGKELRGIPIGKETKHACHACGKLAAAWKKARLGEKSEVKKESSEHPTLPAGTVEQIVEDHEKAKHTQFTHGVIPARTARHGASPAMTEWAELEAAFITPGYYKTNGVAYYYPPEVIDKHAKSFEGKEFFIDHKEANGAEMGVIDHVSKKQLDGKAWLVAHIKIPESQFTQAFLERIENGLIKDVSSTHTFIADPEKKVVESMNGEAISTVREGEVPDAKILRIRRHVKKGQDKAKLRAAIHEKWNKAA